MMITEKARLGWKEVEALKPEYFVDTMKISNESGELGKNENNDCVVRAFAAALDLPYNQAHAWVKKELKRQDRKGTFMSAYSKKDRKSTRLNSSHT